METFYSVYDKEICALVFQAKVVIAEQTEKDIDETRSLYIPVAVRTQILFFCTYDLVSTGKLCSCFLITWRSANVHVLGVTILCVNLDFRSPPEIFHVELWITLFSSKCKRKNTFVFPSSTLVSVAVTLAVN